MAETPEEIQEAVVTEEGTQSKLRKILFGVGEKSTED
jgi:hypothetical protein